MYVFLMKDKECLENFNEIWEKFSNAMKKNFDSEFVYNEKYLNAKNLITKKLTQKCSQCIYISVILIDSVYK